MILVEKFSQNSRFWKNLVRKNKISNLSVEEVVNKYHGFEGNRNFFVHFENDLHNEMNELIKEKKINKYYLITFENNIKNESNEKKNRFMGYDFGICEEDATVYSSIVNEILFGVVEELVSFRFQLNENFLFSDKKALNDYVDLHHKLLLEGRDIEHDENMNVYEIWKIM
jgi:hypothetical protein